MKEKYLSVQNEINDLKAKNNNLQPVKLIAVSKKNSVNRILEVYEAGCRDFGENKVQELLEKQEKLPKDIIWHMIGHLQRNKVKYIIDKVAYIHSVDSFRLAQEISKQASKIKCEMKILLEVNVSKEESKFGILLEEIETVYKETSQLPNIKICGLMTLAPYVINPNENRKYFTKLKKVLVDIQQKNIDNTSMSELSMGMSGDYLVAIEEGATFVRVGTGIFGIRDYSIKE